MSNRMHRIKDNKQELIYKEYFLIMNNFNMLDPIIEET